MNAAASAELRALTLVNATTNYSTGAYVLGSQAQSFNARNVTMIATAADTSSVPSPFTGIGTFKECTFIVNGLSGTAVGNAATIVAGAGKLVIIDSDLQIASPFGAFTAGSGGATFIYNSRVNAAGATGVSACPGTVNPTTNTVWTTSCIPAN